MKARGKFERASGAKRGKLLRVYATSLLSLLLCCTMFVGTTMAWFTDSVNSASSQITAGELGVSLQCEGTAVSDTTAVFEGFTWAPGWALAKQFYVKNDGSLPMQYELKLEAVGETTVTVGTATYDLADYYIVYAKDDVKNSDPEIKVETLDKSPDWKKIGVLSDVLKGKKVFSCDSLQIGDDNDHSVAIAMDVSAPNEIQGKSLNLKVTLNAYQEDAIVPDITISGGSDSNANTEALKDAIANTTGAETIQLGSGEYKIPDNAKGKNLTFVGSGNTVVNITNPGGEGADGALDGSTATFENLTIQTDSATYTGYARLNATYNNCTINGTYTLYGNSEFNNCTFNVSGDVYNIWTWGAPNATFNNCTFNSDGKAILLYSTTNTNLTVNGCTFNDKGGLDVLKAAVEIGNDYGVSYNLTVRNTTVNGYAINDKGINTGTTLWGNKNSMPQDQLNVVVDDVDVY